MLAYCLAATVGTTLGLTYLLPKRYKPRNAVYLTLGLTGLLFGSLTNELHSLLNAPFATPILPFRIAAFTLLIVYFALIWFTRKQALFTVNLYLNVLLGLYCGWAILLLVQKEREAIEITAEALANATPTTQPQAGQQYPDIYFILTDAYTGYQSLRKYYQFDNQYYHDSLRQRGFYVAERAMTNYHVTVRSMAAMMHLDYLPKPRQAKMEIGERTLWIGQNRVNQELFRHGYDFVNESIFDIAHGNERHQGTPNIHANAIFYYSLFTNTLLGKVYYALVAKLGLSDRRMITYQRLKASIRQPRHKPRFAYLHLVLPHFPYKYDRFGHVTRLGNPDRLAGYVAQVQYVNQLLIDLIDDIQAHNPRPAIILVTGDHGSREVASMPLGVDEMFTTTTAFYFPNRRYETLYDSMSSVNLFRAVLNNALGQSLPYLPDQVVRKGEKPLPAEQKQP
jgi:Sulfatase